MSDSLYLATAKEVGGEARIGAALIAIAESVAELVEVIKAQASVERIAGPAVGEPLGYVTIDASGPAARVMLDYLESTPGSAYAVGDVARSTSERVVAVYDLPEATDESTGPRP